MSSRRRTYVESPVIMSTVRIVAPFVLTFGLFVTLHGASSPGGGFQGGVIVAAMIVMLSFAYGADLTWEWLNKRALVGLTAGGVALFVAVSLGTTLFGGDFLELAVYPVEDASKYGIELVEVAIAMIVTGVVVTLFFTLSQGTMEPTGDGDAGGESATDGGEAPDDAVEADADGSGSPERGRETPSGGRHHAADGGERA